MILIVQRNWTDNAWQKYTHNQLWINMSTQTSRSLEVSENWLIPFTSSSITGIFSFPTFAFSFYLPPAVEHTIIRHIIEKRQFAASNITFCLLVMRHKWYVISESSSYLISIIQAIRVLHKTNPLHVSSYLY